MAVNIELNYKSSDDVYEVLYPNTESNYVLASSDLISTLSLTNLNTLDEAFVKVKTLISSAQSRADSAYILASNKISLSYGDFTSDSYSSLTIPVSPNSKIVIIEGDNANKLCSLYITIKGLNKTIYFDSADRSRVVDSTFSSSSLFISQMYMTKGYYVVL